MPAESLLTAVCPDCGKYGTAGGFEAAVAHTENVRRGLHVVSSLYVLNSILPLSFRFVSQVHMHFCQIENPWWNFKESCVLLR